MFKLASLTHTATHAKAVASKKSRLRATGLLGCLALVALFTSGCDDTMAQDEDCPANAGMTRSASEATPGGVTAQEIRAGLLIGASTTVTLHRAHTAEDTQLPQHVPASLDGVAFDLAEGSDTLEVTVEVLPREEGLNYHSVGVGSSDVGQPDAFRCIEQSSMVADIHLRAVDGSFETVIPVDLEYYTKENRDRFPVSTTDENSQVQGQHAFFGKGRVDESQAQGALRLVNPRAYHGQSIQSSGFGVRVGIVDQKIISLRLMASFEFGEGESASGIRAMAQPIYASDL